MIFETDQQTLNDLNILGKYKDFRKGKGHGPEKMGYTYV